MIHVPVIWNGHWYGYKLCAFYRLYNIYSFYGMIICGDVYDRLDYDTHARDKTLRYL